MAKEAAAATMRQRQPLGQHWWQQRQQQSDNLAAINDPDPDAAVAKGGAGQSLPPGQRAIQQSGAASLPALPWRLPWAAPVTAMMIWGGCL